MKFAFSVDNSYLLTLRVCQDLFELSMVQYIIFFPRQLTVIYDRETHVYLWKQNK